MTTRLAWPLCLFACVPLAAVAQSAGQASPPIQVPASMHDTLVATRPAEYDIVLTRRFPASRPALFTAMTQADQLAVWMKPAIMELVTCEVDLRVGGHLRYVFQRGNGRRLEVRGLYQAIDPPTGFVYRESYDFSPLTVLVTTGLAEEAGGTRLTQTLRYNSKQERDDDYDGVVSSATDAFAALARFVDPSSR